MTSRIREIDVYTTPSTMLVVGYVGGGWFRVMQLDRVAASNSSSTLEDVLFAAPELYDRRRVQRMLRGIPRRSVNELRQTHKQEREDAKRSSSSASSALPRRASTTDLPFFSLDVPVHVCRAVALLGMVRFITGAYLVLATERKRRGYIDGHVVYSIARTTLLSISWGDVKGSSRFPTTLTLPSSRPNALQQTTSSTASSAQRVTYTYPTTSSTQATTTTSLAYPNALLLPSSSSSSTTMSSSQANTDVHQVFIHNPSLSLSSQSLTRETLSATTTTTSTIAPSNNPFASSNPNLASSSSLIASAASSAPASQGPSRPGSSLGGSSVHASPSNSSVTSATNNQDAEQQADSFVSRWSRWFSSSNDPLRDTEERYKQLFQLVDLTKDFFFSYTYDLTHTLQDSITPSGSIRTGPGSRPPHDAFQWNWYLLLDLLRVVDRDALPGQDSIYAWNLPVIHGSFGQQRCTLFGRSLTITLIGRRSRFFAGTRYLKRGINQQGNVANEVEVEQIVEADPGGLSSFVQVRGSIPAFWSQETSATVPKPPIKRYKYDASFVAARMHFKNLFSRYGDRVVVLNLVRQFERRPRESLLGDEYFDTIQALNLGLDLKIVYEALDFKRASKAGDAVLWNALSQIASRSLDRVGFFALAPPSSLRRALLTSQQQQQQQQSGLATSSREQQPTQGVPATPITGNASLTTSSSLAHAMQLQPPITMLQLQANDTFLATPTPPILTGALMRPQRQRGVVRTNCIDNLDRTNMGQYSIGVTALARQLAVLDFSELDVRVVGQSTGSSSGSLGALFASMYEQLGDCIAQQYGGSQAHKSGGELENPIDSLVATQRELLTSVRRYYSNSFTDRAKQDAINLFLGAFPRELMMAAATGQGVHLWDMESDFYLHNFSVSSPSFGLSVDPGTTKWWSGSGVSGQMIGGVSRNILGRAGHPSSQSSIARSWARRTLFADEDDAGEFVSFDDVLADEFFKPLLLVEEPPTSSGTVFAQFMASSALGILGGASAIGSGGIGVGVGGAGSGNRSRTSSLTEVASIEQALDAPLLLRIQEEDEGSGDEGDSAASALSPGPPVAGKAVSSTSADLLGRPRRGSPWLGGNGGVVGESRNSVSTSSPALLPATITAPIPAASIPHSSAPNWSLGSSEAYGTLTGHRFTSISSQRILGTEVLGDEPYLVHWSDRDEPLFQQEVSRSGDLERIMSSDFAVDPAFLATFSDIAVEANDAEGLRNLMRSFGATRVVSLSESEFLGVLREQEVGGAYSEKVAKEFGVWPGLTPPSSVTGQALPIINSVAPPDLALFEGASSPPRFSSLTGEPKRSQGEFEVWA